MLFKYHKHLVLSNKRKPQTSTTWWSWQETTSRYFFGLQHFLSKFGTIIALSPEHFHTRKQKKNKINKKVSSPLAVMVTNLTADVLCFRDEMPPDIPCTVWSTVSSPNIFFLVWQKFFIFFIKTLTIMCTYSASCIKIGKEQVTQKILLRDIADGPGFRVFASHTMSSVWTMGQALWTRIENCMGPNPTRRHSRQFKHQT